MRLIVALTFFFAIAAVASIAAAQPCMGAGECASGFCVDDVCCNELCDAECMSCSTITKGGGPDGVCDFSAAGAICQPGECLDDSFSHVPADTCDGAGSCVDGGDPVSCLSDSIDIGCGVDACADYGCEVYKFADGTSCSDELVCNDGRCNTPADGGAPGTGGEGTGNSGGSSAGGDSGNPLAPEEDSGCGCRLAGDDQRSSAIWLLLFGAIVIRRRRN